MSIWLGCSVETLENLSSSVFFLGGKGFGRNVSDKCSLGFFVQGVVSSGVMVLGSKPIAMSLAGRNPSTDPPCQKDQEPLSLAVPGGRVCVCVCGLLRASDKAIRCTSFRRNFSAHIGEFLQIFRKTSTTFIGAVQTIVGKFSTKTSAKFPQFLEVQFAVLQCFVGKRSMKNDSEGIRIRAEPNGFLIHLLS